MSGSVLEKAGVAVQSVHPVAPGGHVALALRMHTTGETFLPSCGLPRACHQTHPQGVVCEKQTGPTWHPAHCLKSPGTIQIASAVGVALTAEKRGQVFR